MKQCRLCPEVVYAKGWCLKHYKQAYNLQPEVKEKRKVYMREYDRARRARPGFDMEHRARNKRWARSVQGLARMFMLNHAAKGVPLADSFEEVKWWFAHRPTHCSRCEKGGRRLVLDVDHRSARIRAWVCDACNIHIGRLESEENRRADRSYFRAFGSVALGLLLVGCQPAAGPTDTLQPQWVCDPATIEDCAPSCATLRSLQCSLGNPTSDGLTCEELCIQTVSSGYLSWPNVSYAQSKQDIIVCGISC